MGKSSIRIILFCLMLVACDKTIHQYPGPVEDEGPVGAASLTLKVRTEAPAVHTVVDCSSGEAVAYTFAEWLEQTRVPDVPSFEALAAVPRVDADTWRLRLVWALYKGSCEEVRSGQAPQIGRSCRYFDADAGEPEHELEFSLPAGDYTLLAWADFVPVSCEGDYHYATGDLRSVLCDLDLRKQCEENAQRDCFAECCEFSTSGVDGEHFGATLTRPQGRYVVLATDYERYVGLTDRPVEANRAVMTYPSFVNVGYTVAEGRPNESATGLTYSFSPRRCFYEEQEAVWLADDFSFVNSDVSHVLLDLGLEYDGRVFVSRRGIDIPLRADRLTVVVGPFLTASGDAGGLGIDEGFDDEIRIEY